MEIQLKDESGKSVENLLEKSIALTNDVQVNPTVESQEILKEMIVDLPTVPENKMLKTDPGNEGDEEREESKNEKIPMQEKITNAVNSAMEAVVGSVKGIVNSVTKKENATKPPEPELGSERKPSSDLEIVNEENKKENNLNDMTNLVNEQVSKAVDIVQDVKEILNEKLYDLKAKEVEVGKEPSQDNLGEAKDADKVNEIANNENDKAEEIEEKIENVNAEHDQTVDDLSGTKKKAENENGDDSKSEPNNEEQAVKNVLTEKIEHLKEMAVEKGEMMKNMVVETVGEIKDGVNDKIIAVNDMITDKLEAAKKMVVDKMERTKDNMAESAKSVSRDIVEGEKMNATEKVELVKNVEVDKAETLKNNLTEKVEDVKDINKDGKMEGAKDVAVDKIDAAKDGVVEKVESLENNVADDSIVNSVDAPKGVDGTIETVKGGEGGTLENNDSEKLEDTVKKEKETTENAAAETPKDILSNKMEAVKDAALDKIETTKNGVIDNMEGMKETVTEKIKLFENFAVDKVKAVKDSSMANEMEGAKNIAVDEGNGTAVEKGESVESTAADDKVEVVKVMTADNKVKETNDNNVEVSKVDTTTVNSAGEKAEEEEEIGKDANDKVEAVNNNNNNTVEKDETSEKMDNVKDVLTEAIARAENMIAASTKEMAIGKEKESHVENVQKSGEEKTQVVEKSDDSKNDVIKAESTEKLDESANKNSVNAVPEVADSKNLESKENDVIEGTQNSEDKNKNGIESEKDVTAKSIINDLISEKIDDVIKSSPNQIDENGSDPTVSEKIVETEKSVEDVGVSDKSKSDAAANGEEKINLVTEKMKEIVAGKTQALENVVKENLENVQCIVSDIVNAATVDGETLAENSTEKVEKSAEEALREKIEEMKEKVANKVTELNAVLGQVSTDKLLESTETNVIKEIAEETTSKVKDLMEKVNGALNDNSTTSATDGKNVDMLKKLQETVMKNLEGVKDLSENLSGEKN